MNFACPSCGFRVFNRRYSKCEHCGRDLPQEMLLTAGQIGKLDADAEASRRAQALRAAATNPPAMASPGLGGNIAVGAAGVVTDIVLDAIQDLTDDFG